MKRGVLNLGIDFLAGACVLGMVATGYVLRFPLPPSTNRTHELWGLSRHQWGTIHSWAGLALLAVLFVHLILHREWIHSMILGRFAALKGAPTRKYFAGIAAVAVLVILGGSFGWATHAGVRELETPRHFLSAVNGGGATFGIGVPAPGVVSFERDVRPIFEASCIDCHGPRKQRGHFRVDRREDFFAPGDPAPLIVPGDAEKSRLISIVSGGAPGMKSAEDHLLQLQDIAILKAWINAGAEWREYAPAK